MASPGCTSRAQGGGGEPLGADVTRLSFKLSVTACPTAPTRKRMTIGFSTIYVTHAMQVSSELASDWRRFKMWRGSLPKWVRLLPPGPSLVRAQPGTLDARIAAPHK